MPMDKTKTRPTVAKVLTEIQSLKGMVANQGKSLKDHDMRISKIEKERELEAVAKEAVEKYRHEEQKSRSSKQITDSAWLTKELVRAIIALIGVVAALVALIRLGASIK